VFTFLLGAGAAFTTPASQSVVTQLVPKQDLSAAVTSNGVGVNISGAIGPALGGGVIGGLGIAAPFWINALSNFAVIGALLWWRPPSPPDSGLPPERLTAPPSNPWQIGCSNRRQRLSTSSKFVKSRRGFLE